MATLADKAILSGADNRPPMLEKVMYDSWKSIMELYMMNRQHGRMIIESVENGPLIWPLIEENRVTRPNKYFELSATEAIQADYDIKATNIILQRLPPEVYALERECKLYDEFDKFSYKKGEHYNTSAIVITDSEENLMLAEESHFKTRFVQQTELSAEQAFWSKNFVNSTEPTLSSRPTKVEVLKELSKVRMVNTSLKKLKYHLAGFDVVVKERTTPTAITKDSWGFEHTKACFKDEIIPFVKALKNLFNTFD
ncbi:hypothetical protein Tco_0328808 [Tanacetum coccineum]